MTPEIKPSEEQMEAVSEAVKNAEVLCHDPNPCLEHVKESFALLLAQRERKVADTLEKRIKSELTKTIKIHATEDKDGSVYLAKVIITTVEKIVLDAIRQEAKKYGI